MAEFTPSRVLTPASLGFPCALPPFNAVQAYGLGIPQEFIQGIGNSNHPFNNKAPRRFLAGQLENQPQAYTELRRPLRHRLESAFPARQSA